LGAEAPVALL
jgi:lysosomal acid lipase/cholesteryl ester hydrolase